MENEFKNEIKVKGLNVGLYDYVIENKGTEIFWLHDHLQCHDRSIVNDSSILFYCQSCGAVLYEAISGDFIPCGKREAASQHIKERFMLSNAEARLAVKISTEWWSKKEELIVTERI